MPHWGPPSAMILWPKCIPPQQVSEPVSRADAGAHCRLYVNVNYRMDSSALWADYVLPAASHYEAWETRQFPFPHF